MSCWSHPSSHSLGAPLPYTSMSRLPRLSARVSPGQSEAFYQLYKASGGGQDRSTTKRVHCKVTGWDAPSYMDSPTNPALKPFSRLVSEDLTWSPEDSRERLEPFYGEAFVKNPQALDGTDGFSTPTTPWNEWTKWSVY